MSYDTKVIEVNNIGKCYLIYKKPIHRLFQMVTRNKIKKKVI